MFAIPWARHARWGLVVWLALASMSLGCAHVISDTVRAQAEPSLAFVQLRDNPDAHKGRTVILGGEILETTNLREGTRLEVLQKPLSRSEAPMMTDSTGGRFMALCDDYLDPAIYAKGRRVTVAGSVLGSYTGKVGEVDYRYPLISCQETHLWPRTVVLPRPYYHDPWYGPRYPYPYAFWPPHYRWPYYRYW
jgi:outer membrane lipoprotein